MEQKEKAELWNDWSPEPPEALPVSFSERTVRLAVLAKNNLLAVRTFQIGSLLAIFVAGVIAWNFCRDHSHPESPPAFSLFHSAGSPRVFGQP